jgi:O-acetylhomoserine (thiol)-lyase
MGGHGTVLGGAIIDSGRFRWTAKAAHYPGLTQPDPAGNFMVFTERFGATAHVARCRNVYLRVFGAALSPFSAFLIERGMETLPLRMERHVRNAAAAASFLRQHKQVAWVSHAGDVGDKGQARLLRYAGGAACPVFTFGLKGGIEAARQFYDSLGLIKRAVNVGDVRSLACHPASTTHRQMPQAAMLAAGIRPEAVRLSIGLEHESDIIRDLDQALRRSAIPRAA